MVIDIHHTCEHRTCIFREEQWARRHVERLSGGRIAGVATGARAAKHVVRRDTAAALGDGRPKEVVAPSTLTSLSNSPSSQRQHVAIHDFLAVISGCSSCSNVALVHNLAFSFCASFLIGSLFSSHRIAYVFRFQF